MVVTWYGHSIAYCDTTITVTGTQKRTCSLPVAWMFKIQSPFNSTVRKRIPADFASLSIRSALEDLYARH